ncbi:phage tail protein [Proteus vulgaris]|uniref:phage tail protein n=1 Tax=Proteus vulgaris TaxID=585 RepID=UPI0021A3ED96|nr:phage tail protein [Proteus vulgaris]
MKNPKLISKPFAQNGQKNVIPEKYETSMESNQATWDQGFGQITMLPVSAGGLPPKGQDFNGILNQMCETIVHISKGGVFKFSVDYATAINGYPKGAILQSEDEKKYYQSLIDNNKVNFNTASQDQIKTSWKLVMTDDLLDQLSKKLESSAVVQTTGTSTTSVMSQKSSTNAFQPKGNYADKSSSSVQYFAGSIVISGEIAARNSSGNSIVLKSDSNGCRINFTNDGEKWNNLIPQPDKSGEFALVGDSYTKSEANAKYQPKGNYELSGTSYTKSESDSKYQPKGNYQNFGYSYSKSESNDRFQRIGNYADKSSSSVQYFAGSIVISGEIAARNSSGNSIVLKSDSNGCRINFTNDGEKWNNLIPQQSKSGFIALVDDIENSELVPHPIPWSLSTAPSGYLICQGQTFNKATYPKLAIAYPSGRLPELRSEFIRGADAGRGIDTGREVLSSQSGNSLLSARGMGGNSEFSLKMTSGSVGTDNQGQREIYQQIEGQNGNETRPRNIAFLYIVRAA